MVGHFVEEEGVAGCVGPGRGRERDDGDAKGEEDEREPAFGSQGAVEYQNAEYSCDYDLVGALD